MDSNKPPLVACDPKPNLAATAAHVAANGSGGARSNGGKASSQPRGADAKAAQQAREAALSTPKDINTIVTAVAASKLGLTEQLRAALEGVRDVVHTRDADGRTCLHYAAGA